MKLNIRNAPLQIAFVFVLLFPALMLMAKNDLIPRVYLEGVYILLAFFLIVLSSKNYLLIFLISILFLVRLLVTNSFVVSAYDFAALPLLLYYSWGGLRESCLNICILFLIFIEFFFGVQAFIQGNFIDFNRIGGLFPSSMHYAFSTAGLSFALFLSNIKYKNLIFGVVLASAVLSGSRAAFICVSFLYVVSLVQELGFFRLFSLLFVLSAVFFSFNSVDIGSARSVSYVEDSDSVRFSGYYDWLDRQSLYSTLFGVGRFYVGSIGVVNNGDSSLITESSILTFVEGYGVLIASSILLAPFYLFYKMLRLSVFLPVAGVFFLVCFLGPFLETTSILCVNSLMISSALRNKLIMNQ